MVVARRASRARTGGYVIAAAGALLLLAFAVPLFGIPLDIYWLMVGFRLAMAIGFGMLAVAGDGPSRIAFGAAAAGWAILVAAVFLPLGILVGIANLLLVFGGLVGAVLLVSHGRSGRTGAGLLVIAMLLLVVYVFPVLIPFLPPEVFTAVPPLLGAALLAAGIMLPRR
ncbi:MAG: hypothetical protein JWP66_1862 [Naasia sp.]|nr:hypothetical protein [Naasia sp.]